MPRPLAALRESRGWWFDLGVLVLGLGLFATSSAVVVFAERVSLPLIALLTVPVVVVVARFPMVLDNGDGSIEVGFDSCLLMFLLCMLDVPAALVVWSLGVIATQLPASKRVGAKVFNIGVGILAGGLAAFVMYAVRGPETGTPRELLAVALGAAAYFAADYLLSAVSVAIDSATSLRGHLVQRGTWLAIACFVPFDVFGYLAAVVLRTAPWWTLMLLVVPLATLLVATRAVTRGSENARRLTVLFGAAVAAQTAQEPEQVVDALLADARSLLRLKQVELRPTPPGPSEIGTQVRRDSDASWIVAPARTRARSTMAADQQALEALAAVASDAFARLQLTEKMVHLARYDLLTALPNRGVLLDRLVQALQSARDSGAHPALLFVDLDGFKPINDRCGHAAGDAVLVEVGRRLSSCVRESDTVARMGGDEFAVLLEDVGLPEVSSVCERIQAALSETFSVAGQRVQLCASIGIAYGDETGSAESMLRSADLAMYEAKGRGQGRSVVYEAAIGRARMERLELTEQLRAAIDNAELTVVYQPVVTAATGRIIGVEALARWRNGGVDVPPDVFIRLAEETGLIVALGDVVLAKAAGDAAAICGAASREMSIGINISAAQLRDPGFVGSVENAVARIGAAELVLEITEREEIGRDPVVLQAMHTIADMNVLFAIDDFGVGFSSISYLQGLPVRIIKVDASLVQNIDRDERATALLRSITMMGRALGLDVVVEGVERESQQALVCEAVRAPYMQGYLLHRPMPLPQLLDVLRRERRGDASGQEASAGGGRGVRSVPVNTRS